MEKLGQTKTQGTPTPAGHVPASQPLNKWAFLRVFFFLACFLLANATEIHVMGVCGSSPCRSDDAGSPFYLTTTSNVLIAPTSLLTVPVQSLAWPVRVKWDEFVVASFGSPVRELWRAPFLGGLLPMRETTLDFPTKQTLITDSPIMATGRTFAFAHFLQKLLILLSLPWWELLYRGIASVYRSRKWVAVGMLVILGTSFSLGALLIRVDLGGEAAFTWELIREVLAGGDGSGLLSRFPGP